MIASSWTIHWQKKTHLFFCCHFRLLCLVYDYTYDFNCSVNRFNTFQANLQHPGATATLLWVWATLRQTHQLICIGAHILQWHCQAFNVKRWRSWYCRTATMAGDAHLGVAIFAWTWIVTAVWGFTISTIHGSYWGMHRLIWELR